MFIIFILDEIQAIIILTMLNITQNYLNNSNVFDKNQIADKLLTKLEVILLILVFLFTIIGNLGVILILVIFKNGLTNHAFNSPRINSIKNKSRELRFQFYPSLNNISRMSFYIIQ